MSGRGPPGLDLMNIIRNRQHRGRRGVGIDLLIWSYGRLGCQVHQKGGKYNVERPRGPVYQNPFDHIVPMMGGSTEAIKRFIQELVFIFLEIWVANWRSYYSDLIIWKGGVTERVLTVTLLYYSFISQ